MTVSRLFFAATGVALLATTARGQVTPDTPANPAVGFSVKKEPQAVVDAFEDFERYRDKKAWEKAFTALAKIDDTSTGRLVADRDGFYVPVSTRVRGELISLPADGREAYRLFNDAKAADLFKQATGTGDVATLHKLVDRYFVTAVGDQAADRLGDALFEAGDFAAAERCWRLIIDNYPDSALPAVQLQTKRAIAFSRAGDREGFDPVFADITNRYAGQSVRLGGRDVPVADALAGLRPAEAGVSTAVIPSTNLQQSTVAGMPAADAPTWELPLMDADMAKQLSAQLNQIGWGAMAGQFEQSVPAAAVDDRRVYVNWLGICFAADLHTGKLLWRTDSFTGMTASIQQNVMQGMSIDSQGNTITVAGDRVFVVRRTTDNTNGQSPARMLCLAADTGKMIWRSEKGTLADWMFVGGPVVDGTDLIAVAHPSASQELSLVCLAMKDGAVRWKVLLGTPSVGTDMRGQPTTPYPTIARRGDKIDVLTNNGAVLEIDPANRRVDWAFTYPTIVDTQPMYYYNNFQQGPPIGPGAMVVDGPTIYCKEHNGNMLYAVDAARAELKWKRPVDAENTVAAVDGRRLLLTGIEAQCIDLDTRDLLWNDELSTGTAAARPLLAGGKLYLFGKRGVHAVDPATGESSPPYRGHDRDSTGGTVWKTPDRLITVSSRAVTAYALVK